MTIDCDKPPFQIGPGTLWEGETLHSLYQRAYTPWDWHEELFGYARSIDIDCFSTPFDDTAVELLEKLEAPVYKVASFENGHLPLLRRIAQTKKPVIMSLGMATLGDIDESVRTLRDAGAREIALLKCTSAYPAPPEEANLQTIPHISAAFDVVAGLSDHTMGTAVAVAAVALGASIVEKHFTRSRSIPGPDSAFSLEPHELEDLIKSIRMAEKALGRVSYDLTEKQKASVAFRRSVFVVRDIQPGEAFTTDNVRIIRPGHGLAPRHFEQILGRRAAQRVERGTPLSWDLVAG
jgi:pseudaminic acid synthase